MVSSPQILGSTRNTPSRHGLVLAVLALCALAGCGQKGPLYFPTIPAPPVLNVPAPQTPLAAPQVPASAAR
ncbi:MAG: lipoprotein [Polaromonas sp.]|uniref:LPS translocon maturation chaperone LptM n=1 Tax=Polaromonas sp. TaxID=1869339 RepID=UPI0025F9900C|nr:lipoprotein [Polaromonas sp.]MBI2727381.1 lipoprotein [Polaromonas sp.]